MQSRYPVNPLVQPRFPDVMWVLGVEGLRADVLLLPKPLGGTCHSKVQLRQNPLPMTAIFFASQRSRPSSTLVLRLFVRQMHGSGAIQPRIHILGIGNLGKLVAHALKKSAPQLPVTLLFHRSSLVPEWEKAGRKITRSTDCDHDQTSGFDVELFSLTANPTTKIHNLVVATKTYATTAALALIKQRLSPECHILFVQNGFGSCNLDFSQFVHYANAVSGVLDEASEQLFGEPQWQNLTYWTGISSAGVYSTAPFHIVHAGRGPLSIGMVRGPTLGHDTVPPSGFMIDRLLDAEILDAAVHSPKVVKEAQLRKLVVNAMINPMTVVHGCKNGQLFSDASRLARMRDLFLETAQVVSRMLGNTSCEPGKSDFTDELWEHVCSVGRATGENFSSMLQDLRAGRRTEIDYINGVIIEQGEQLGIPTPLNQELVRLVKQAGQARG